MLASADIASLKRLASSRPTARLHLASREDRLHDPSLRAAFSLWSLKVAPRHLQPCQRCGLATACWCEACEALALPNLPPVAICTHCDSEHLICETCERSGMTWTAAREAYQRRHPEEFEGRARVMNVTAIVTRDDEADRVAPRARDEHPSQ